MPSTIVGAVLVVVAVVDLLVGWWVVVPRASEAARPVLRLAFAVGSVILLALGLAILLGVLPLGTAR